MRKTILSLLLIAVAAMPTLNAQQGSPSQTTATQQTPKPKAVGTRVFPQPRVQPTEPRTANYNSLNGKRAANNPGSGKPAVNDPGNGKASDNNIGRGQTTKNSGDNYADAMRRYRHERHDCDWWKQHYIVIVLVGGGYYYRDAGYWYPAWGYDPNYERYDYDGPIYTYGNLLPDQVIINVQRVLQQIGYYTGDLNGSLGVDTRRALTAYQQDYGLDATGVVDEATVRSLGLI
jgi:Putative peptidoglycan binding domain